jgi:flagellar M-ring protein FliF
VASKLRDQKVQYQLADGGRTVRVPEDQLDQLRLDLSAQGLPTSGRIGFEIFDRTQFGATEFLEQVNYRRALEGELARTISTISEVASARVHLALPKESLFATREQPAKASVVLRLRNPSRPLAAATVHGVASLVAASVEGLRAEAVVVVDSFGRPLARPQADEEEPLGAAQVERQQRFEREMATRVVALLEPIVGIDRVRVNVAARLSSASEDQVEERWDPAGVVRSRAVSTEGSPAGALEAGVAGAQANLPASVPPGSDTPAAPSVAQASAPLPVAATGRSSETTNYEIGKVVRHTVRPRGDVARLSVAVIVDDDRVAAPGRDGATAVSSKPRDPAQMQKIQELVAAAVGLDPARGDQVTVQNIAFDEAPVEPVQPAGLVERFGPTALEVGRIVAVLVVGLAALLFVGRPLMTRALHPAPAGAGAAHQLPRTIEDIEGELEAQLAAGGQIGDRRAPVLTKRLTGLAQKEPESAARLVRAWLVEDRK